MSAISWAIQKRARFPGLFPGFGVRFRHSSTLVTDLRVPSACNTINGSDAERTRTLQAKASRNKRTGTKGSIAVVVECSKRPYNARPEPICGADAALAATYMADLQSTIERILDEVLKPHFEKIRSETSKRLAEELAASNAGAGSNADTSAMLNSS